MLPTSQVRPGLGENDMIRLRKKNVLVFVVAVVLALLVAAPVFAAEIPDGDGKAEGVTVCKFDGQVKITLLNIYDDAGNYYEVCTGETLCEDLGWLGWEEKGYAVLPYGEGCVWVRQCLANNNVTALAEVQLNGCGGWEIVDQVCDREFDWPMCPVNEGCTGGAGLYPPSHSGVPYNGYNDAGYFILAVDNHCDHDVSLVDVFVGDPLSTLTQVMTLWVDDKGWTQIHQDDVENIQDMYGGEIWFKVHGWGDRYYGLHELMTHPNLGSAD